MHAAVVLGSLSFIFTSMVSFPVTKNSIEPQLPREDVWPVDLTNILGNDKYCGHAAILLIREDRHRIAVLDAAGRRLLVTIPLKDDGSASLDTYSAALHAHLDVAVSAGSGPRTLEVLKTHPVLCRYHLAP